MSIIEISIGKSKYKIQCPEEESEKLLRLAERLDERVNNLAINLKNVDEKTLLVIAALMAEDDSESANTSVAANNNLAQEKINDEDMYIAIAENIENVAEYIEKLAKKIENC